MGSLFSDKKPQDDPKKDEEDANQEGWDDDDFILLLLDNTQLVTELAFQKHSCHTPLISHCHTAVHFRP